MEVQIKEISPADESVVALFKLLDAHNMSYCSPEICHLTQPNELEKFNYILLGAFCDGELCGMGGLKFYEGYAEVTRMHVKEEYQGNKIGKRILEALENRALEKGLTALKLETSMEFKKAVGLYTKYGFTFCEPFGEYINKPFNTYMEKVIGTCT